MNHTGARTRLLPDFILDAKLGKDNQVQTPLPDFHFLLCLHSYIKKCSCMLNKSCENIVYNITIDSMIICKDSQFETISIAWFISHNSAKQCFLFHLSNSHWTLIFGCSHYVMVWLLAIYRRGKIIHQLYCCSSWVLVNFMYSAKDLDK